MDNSLPADQPIAEPEIFVRLRTARHRMLQLHKMLLDAERARYEQVHGAVAGGKLLQLVIDDPQFAWLRSISALIVRIDEMFDGEEPATSEQAQTLAAEVRELLQPDESGSDFAQKYFAALQSDPDAVLANRDIRQALTV